MQLRKSQCFTRIYQILRPSYRIRHGHYVLLTKDSFNYTPSPLYFIGDCTPILHHTTLLKKITQSGLEKAIEVIIGNIGYLARNGGGSFGPYRVKAMEPNGFIRITKKPRAKNKHIAMRRLLELTKICYKVTPKQELEAGPRLNRESNRFYDYTYVRRWNVPLAMEGPQVQFYTSGSTLSMRMGNTLAIITGMLLNPYSDYYDINAKMDPNSYEYNHLPARYEHKEQVIKQTHLEHWLPGKLYRPDPNDYNLYVTRTRSHSTKEEGSAVPKPSVHKVTRSFWFNSYNGPDYPEFHFYLDYANKFTLQYSPMGKKEWILLF